MERLLFNILDGLHAIYLQEAASLYFPVQVVEPAAPGIDQLRDSVNFGWTSLLCYGAVLP